MMVLFDHADYPIWDFDSVRDYVATDLGTLTGSLRGDSIVVQSRASLTGYLGSNLLRTLISDIDIRISGRGGFGAMCSIINQFAWEASQAKPVDNLAGTSLCGHIRLRVSHGSTVVKLDYNTITSVITLHYDDCNRANVMSQSGLVKGHSYLPKYDGPEQYRSGIVNFTSTYVADGHRCIVEINPGNVHVSQGDEIFVKNDGCMTSIHNPVIGSLDLIGRNFCEGETVWLSHPVRNDPSIRYILSQWASWMATRLNHFEEVTVHDALNVEGSEEYFVKDLRAMVPQMDESDGMLQIFGMTELPEEMFTDMCRQYISDKWNVMNGGTRKPSVEFFDADFIDLDQANTTEIELSEDSMDILSGLLDDTEFDDSDDPL